MKPYEEIINYPVENSFIVKYDNFPHFNVPLHFHSEYEIVYIIKSTGRKYVGDTVEEFGPGDISFYGNNLHHFYLNDQEYYQNDPDYVVNAIIVLFPSDYFSPLKLNQPEFSNIKALLNNSSHGLKFHKKIAKKASNILYQMLKASGIERYMLLLKLLDFLGSSESVPLTKIRFTDSISIYGEHRMEKIYKFCKYNFNRKITLKEISSLAAMDSAAFCRYFKQIEGKTFKQYINDMRISFSCEMLKNGYNKISFISSKAGFNNISNFNRTFLKVVGKTPNAFRKFYLKD
jgi:AraC-like DNA-binding protein